MIRKKNLSDQQKKTSAKQCLRQAPSLQPSFHALSPYLFNSIEECVLFFTKKKKIIINNPRNYIVHGKRSNEKKKNKQTFVQHASRCGVGRSERTERGHSSGQPANEHLLWAKMSCRRLAMCNVHAQPLAGLGRLGASIVPERGRTRVTERKRERAEHETALKA